MTDTPVTDMPGGDAPGGDAHGAGTVGVSAGAGRLLRAAREAKGLSTGAIATHLNLDVRTVEALERDDHTRLPAPIFVRGYLRNYARLIGLPEDEVLGTYQIQAPAEPAPRRVGLPRRQRSFRAPRIPWAGLFTVLLLGALGVVAWRLGPDLVARFSGEAPLAGAPAALTLPASDGEAAADAGAPPPGTGMLELPLPEAPAAPTDIGEPIPLDEVEPVLPPEAEMEPGAGSVTDAPFEAAAPPPAETEMASAGAPVTEPPTAEAPVAEPAVPGELRLELRFTDDSWVEISAADGRRLLYGLLRKDEQRSVAGRAPLRVLLGNARAVELKVDGAPFDLAPHTRDAIARFRLDVGR